MTINLVFAIFAWTVLPYITNEKYCNKYHFTPYPSLFYLTPQYQSCGYFVSIYITSQMVVTMYPKISYYPDMLSERKLFICLLVLCCIIATKI